MFHCARQLAQPQIKAELHQGAAFVLRSPGFPMMTTHKRNFADELETMRRGSDQEQGGAAHGRPPPSRSPDDGGGGDGGGAPLVREEGREQTEGDEPRQILAGVPGGGHSQCDEPHERDDDDEAEAVASDGRRAAERCNRISAADLPDQSAVGGRHAGVL